MKTEKLQIEKEKHNYLGEFGPVVVAIVVLIVLILLLVFVFKVDISKLGGKDKDKNSGDIPFQELTVNPSLFNCGIENAEKIMDAVGKVNISYTNESRVYTQYESDNPEEGMVDVYGYMYDIKFENIPKDVYIRITNNSPTEELYQEIKYDDTKKGTYTYSFPGTTSYLTYLIEFVAIDSSDCAKSVIRKVEFSPDANNIFSSLGICTAQETWEIMKDFEYCSLPTIPKEKFLTFNEVMQKAQEYKNQRLKEIEEGKVSTKENKKNNKVVIILILVVILIVAIVAILLIRRKTGKKRV